MPESMYGHCQVSINETHVFFADGVNGTAYILDWSTKEYSLLEDIPGNPNKDYITCGAIYNNLNGQEIVIVSRGSSSIFNVLNMTWRQGPDVEIEFVMASAAQLGSTFVVVGGCSPEDEFENFDSVFVFDAVNYEFVLSDVKLDVAVRSAGVVALPDDYVRCS